MKRILSLAIAFIFVTTLAGCGRQEKAKDEIFNLVEQNYDALVKACQANDVDALYAIKGVEEIAFRDNYVVVYCMGMGIAPSSQDYGFYYSRENRPAAVDCNLRILCETEDLKPEGNGYEYFDKGYNCFYTEHIRGNIYFYSAVY